MNRQVAASDRRSRSWVGTIGGELGGVLDQIGSTLDNLGEKGTSFGAKLTAGGAGLAGAGAALTMIGSAGKEAENQLDTAITNTGNSMKAPFKGRSTRPSLTWRTSSLTPAKDTDAALTVLTQGTNDPQKALSEMGLVANLAASQHESLAAAAGAGGERYSPGQARER